MNTATESRPTTQARPAAHGLARWCGLKPDADLLEMGTALLSITPTLADGRPGETVCYWVRSILAQGGKIVGYEMTKEDGAVYVLDTSFGPLPEHWECSCAASQYTIRRTCKHRSGLAAALRAVGL